MIRFNENYHKEMEGIRKSALMVFNQFNQAPKGSASPRIISAGPKRAKVGFGLV